MVMKKLIALLLFMLIAFTGLVAQESTSSKPNNITSGFYMKFGPSFPVALFKTTQVAVDDFIPTKTFEPAKVGAFGDFGYLIYLGPSFARRFLRAGIDVTFLTIGFNPSDHTFQPDQKKIDYYYFFAGQKMGPLVTINPIDKLMIDLSWKLGFYASGYNDDYGSNLTQQELSLGLRYRLIAFSLNYHFGKINYNDFDSENAEKWARVDALKIMIGLKF